MIAPKAMWEREDGLHSHSSIQDERNSGCTTLTHSQDQNQYFHGIFKQYDSYPNILANHGDDLDCSDRHILSLSNSLLNDTDEESKNSQCYCITANMHTPLISDETLISASRDEGDQVETLKEALNIISTKKKFRSTRQSQVPSHSNPVLVCKGSESEFIRNNSAAATLIHDHVERDPMFLITYLAIFCWIVLNFASLFVK